MSNSSLVDFTKLSPNYNLRGLHTIKKITIHHAASITSVESMGSLFASKERNGSANYGIGNDGRVGLYVPENKRAWTSGSPENDYQAITIEVSNSSTGGDWPVSDAAYEKLILLCADICKRNGIKELIFTGDATGNLTMHRYFQKTACPGEYLASRFGEIAERVNEILKGEEPMTKEEKQEFNELKTQVSELQSKLAAYESGKVYDNAAIRWAYIDGNLPKWAKPTIQKLYNNKLLQGNEKGSLELSYLFIRILVILDRAGMFDKK